MTGRLKLRRGVVVEEEPLTVEVGGERRPAWADTALLGEMRAGDEVVVNVEARDLGLGSGGFDVVHVNLTRGLDGPGASGEHVMKLNYTSLQHPVAPVESRGAGSEPLPVRITERMGPKLTPQGGRRAMRVLVIPLHGHLAPATWAAARGSEGGGDEAGGTLRVGYVQSGGGALPGSLSRDVAELRERGLLAGHIAAAPAYGGDSEALSVAGALEAAGAELAWDAAIVGPGPGIIGSATRLGHGGMAALENAHSALALDLPVTLSPRLSAADPRERHRPVSHHTATVMAMLLAEIEVAMPAGYPEAAERLRELADTRHEVVELEVELAEYAASGLPRRTMGRDLEEDPLFFAAALAAGAALRRKD